MTTLDYKSVYQHDDCNQTEGRALHIVAGPTELFYPLSISVREIERSIGTTIRSVPLFWLQRDGGRYTHDILLESINDNRIPVFLRSLTEDFGGNVFPLIILPALANEYDSENQGLSPLHLIEKIVQGGGIYKIFIYLFDFPNLNISSRSRKLQFRLRKQVGVEIDFRILHCPEQHGAYSIFQRNLMANKIAHILAERLSLENITTDLFKLTQTVVAQIDKWAEDGIALNENSAQHQLQDLASHIQRFHFGVGEL